jgi:hypothetical protein
MFNYPLPMRLVSCTKPGALVLNFVSKIFMGLYSQADTHHRENREDGRGMEARIREKEDTMFGIGYGKGKKQG